MDKTLMGLIEIDPKVVLIDGIRKELVKNMSKVLHETFIFKNKHSNQELREKFSILKTKFAGIKESFEYIQDYLNIQGDKIWHEEIQRIFSENLDREAIYLVNKKYLPHLEEEVSTP